MGNAVKSKPVTRTISKGQKIDNRRQNSFWVSSKSRHAAVQPPSPPFKVSPSFFIAVQRHPSTNCFFSSQRSLSIYMRAFVCIVTVIPFCGYCHMWVALGNFDVKLLFCYLFIWILSTLYCWRLLKFVLFIVKAIISFVLLHNVGWLLIESNGFLKTLIYLVTKKLLQFISLFWALAFCVNYETAFFLTTSRIVGHNSQLLGYYIWPVIIHFTIPIC